MGDRTKIEWSDATWNPILGCTHVSAGCDNCYAAREASGRLSVHPLYAGLASGGKFNGTVRLVPERLTQPLRWRKPRRVFVNSMSDLFHKDVPDEFIAHVWQTMAATPQHTYQILTKRPARMRAWLRRCADWQGYITHNGQPPGAYNDDGSSRGIIVGYRPSTHTKHYGPRSKGGARTETTTTGSWPLANVWLGVSVEDQKRADLRIPALLDTPAAVRWLSCEPLLGPVDLTRVCGNLDVLSGDVLGSDGRPYEACPAAIDWVVVGGESGPKARPMHPEWARTLRDQTKAAGRALLVKQWGEWAPVTADDPRAVGFEPGGSFGSVIRYDDGGGRSTIGDGTPYTPIARVGKKTAGRELDGRLWDEYPAAAG